MQKTFTLKSHTWILLLAVLVLLVFPQGFVYASAIHSFFYGVVTTVFGWLVMVGALVLNYGLNTFVIGFGREFTTSGVGTIVNATWVIFRDLFNLTFIFGLVYIGFKMILRTDDGQTRRWLIQLILAALLVNFSLFITKFIVDFSNILAVEIMNQDRGIFPPDTRVGAHPNDVDLSRAMQNITRVVTVNDDGVPISEDTLPGGANFTFIFGTMFLYIVTAFVYFSAGVLLIIRGAVLLVLMILSPFLFLGMVLPMFANFSRNLWHTLLKRAFMAPIYVALLFLSMQLAGALIGTANFAAALRAGGGDAAVTASASAFGPFIIVIVLLLMSLVAAQKLGAEGATTAIRVGQNLRQRGQRVVGSSTFGVAARVGRSTAGAGADYASKTRRLQTMAKQKGLRGIAGRTAMRSSQKIADASFDARNVAGLGRATGLGTGKKGGFVTRQKEDQKNKEDMLKAIGTVDIKSSQGRAEVAAFKKEMESRAQHHDKIKDKTLEELDNEIESRGLAVEDGKADLKKAKGDNSTKEEIAALQSELDLNEKLLKQTQQLKAEKSSIAELEKQNAELTKEYETEVAQHGENSREAKAVFAARQPVQQQINVKQGSIESAGGEYRERAANAAAEVKYQNQVAYMKTLEDAAQFKQDIANVLSGTAFVNAIRSGFKQDAKSGPASIVTGASAAAAANPLLGASATVGLAGSVTAGAAMSGSAHMDRQTIAGLVKKSGRTAKEMASKDREYKAKKERVAMMTEDMKEVGDNNETPAKPDETS